MSAADLTKSTKRLSNVKNEDKAGWLTKSDPAKYFFSTERWFSLNVEDGTLDYSLVENGPVKGRIQLRSVVGVGDSQVDDMNMFRIILPNR